MPIASINGAKIWYETWGEGQPILFHHGFTACRANWIPIANQLATRYQVIMMECRGAGQSEDTDEGYNLEQYALDTLGLLDLLEIDQVSFAGHSMGGGVGYILATQHSQRLTRLILMAPIPSGGSQRSTEQAALDIYLEAKRRGDRAFFMADQLKGRFRSDVQTEAWFESRVDQLLRISEGHLLGGLQAMRNLDVTEKLADIQVPTLMLAGGVDGLLDANIADYQRLPDASLHVFSRAGHDVAIHEPEAVSTAIDDFMQHGPMTAAKLNARAFKS